jgi:hypothetical protein
MHTVLARLTTFCIVPDNVPSLSDQMIMGRRAIIVGGILLLVVGAIAYSRSASYRAHEQLVRFRASLTLGLSQNEVEATFRSGQYGFLTLLREPDDIWAVETPIEFGGGNWCLRLVFKDKSLNGVLVRTPDEPHQRPADAPPDILPGDSRAR